MSFDTDKCKVMHLGRTNKAYVSCLDNVPLVEVTEEKDLGIIISKALKISKQCESAYSKASRALGLISRTIMYRSTKVMLRLYESVGSDCRSMT